MSIISDDCIPKGVITHKERNTSTSGSNELLCDAPFVVTVNVMEESHQTTYWVCLDRGDRPKDAKPWDAGRITPFKHTNKEYADEEAKSWAEFLGVEVTTKHTEPQTN